MNHAKLRAFGDRWYGTSLLTWVATWIVFAVLAHHVGLPLWITMFPIWGPPALWFAYNVIVYALALLLLAVAVVLRPWLR